MAVRLAQERLSAAAPAGAQVEMKQRRRWEPARTWKLEGILGGGRAKESHNINFLTLAEGKFSCEEALWVTAEHTGQPAPCKRKRRLRLTGSYTSAPELEVTFHWIEDK